MGDYSRDTFDKLKHYVGVRLQQGVPLIDADWNEMEDIRKDQLRLFLELYIGDGIPRGNDGFALQPRAGTQHDFTIEGGSGGNPGICLVKGMDVRNQNDTHYTAQLLFDNAGLAQKWGVAPLATLTLPSSGTRTDLVYIDAWEREVGSQEDATLVNPAIGMETCVRTKREWVVRVAEGTTSLPALPEGHAFYTLAVLTRRAGQPVIAQADFADKRRKNIEPMDNAFSDVVSVQDQHIYLDKDVKSTGRFYDQTGYVMPPGGIIMWSGAVTGIPQGWALCDGGGETPDLRNRFIVGAGDNYSPGNKGGADSVTLGANQVPSHNHTVNQTPHNHANAHYDRLVHYNGHGTETSVDRGHFGSEPNLQSTRVISASNANITINAAGGGQGHENRPPYYALCYIMKL